jgi:maltose alpha-D-glucosyltransferase / alpha-amylase
MLIASDQTSPSYPTWLEDAVFYEIYPQSFNDSNGDGIGDIPGIIARLDYLVSLGVNAVWLNPCFVSPFQDAGYDISDFYQVAPRYGTNADLENLFAEARRRGIRIFLDLVPGHTSWDHPWFKESARHARNAYSDWFIWTNSVWASTESLKGVSGLYERNGSYITNFFAFQPALNFGFASPDTGHPWQQPVDAPGPVAVRQEIKNIMRFWLERGAAGFRVDMAFSLVKNDGGRRETQRFWQEIRAWLESEYPEAALVSEWGRPAEALRAGFHMDFLLHFSQPGYTSLFRKRSGNSAWNSLYGWNFFDRAGHGNIREFIDEYWADYQATHQRGLMAIPSGNHDMGQRLSEGRDARDLACAFTFLMTMPGVPFIYYGDEIGMRTIPDLPSKEGGFERTGARTPMQWDEEGPNAGFSSASPEALYLPIDPRPERPNVAGQTDDPGSLLNQVRVLIALRKQHPALCAGAEFSVLYAEAGQYPLVYERRVANAATPRPASEGADRLVVAINPSGRPVQVELPAGLSRAAPVTLYGADGVFSAATGGWSLSMPAVSAGVYRVA